MSAHKGDHKSTTCTKRVPACLQSVPRQSKQPFLQQILSQQGSQSAVQGVKAVQGDCETVTSGLQVAKPAKIVVGVAGALIGAAAAMQTFAVPAAGMTCTCCATSLI